MKDTRVEEQEQVNLLIRRAYFYGLVWVAGFGSIRAILYANQALKNIKQSQYRLLGSDSALGAKWIGIIGVCIWFPFVIIGIIISIINN